MTEGSYRLLSDPLEKVRYYDTMFALVEWDWRGFGEFVARHSPDGVDMGDKIEFAKYLVSHFPCLAGEYKRGREALVTGSGK